MNSNDKIGIVGIAQYYGASTEAFTSIQEVFHLPIEQFQYIGLLAIPKISFLGADVFFNSSFAGSCKLRIPECLDFFMLVTKVDA